MENIFNISNNEKSAFSLPSELQGNIQDAVHKFKHDNIMGRIFASRTKVANMLGKANIIIKKAEKNNVISRIAKKFGEYKTKPNKLAYACGLPIYIVTSIFLFSDISYDIFNKITDTMIERIAEQYILSLKGQKLEAKEQMALLEDIIKKLLT